MTKLFNYRVCILLLKIHVKLIIWQENFIEENNGVNAYDIRVAYHFQYNYVHPFLESKLGRVDEQQSVTIKFLSLMIKSAFV